MYYPPHTNHNRKEIIMENAIKIIEFLIDYILDNPPSYITDDSPIPLEVFINSQNERARAYFDILEIAIAYTQKK